MRADHLAAALRRGDVVVVWCAEQLPLQAARETARRCSEQVLQALGRRPHGVSRSATEGLACVAFDDLGPVGVDLEAIKEIDALPWQEVLHPCEDGHPRHTSRFYDLWTRKEALTKALGVGLALDLRLLACGGFDARWQPARAPGFDVAFVRSLAPAAGFSAAVAGFSAARTVLEVRFSALGASLGMAP